MWTTVRFVAWPLIVLAVLAASCTGTLGPAARGAPAGDRSVPEASAAPGASGGACRITRELSPVGLVGGDLALRGPNRVVAGEKNKVAWLARAEPTPMLRIRAERLDVAAPALHFEAPHVWDPRFPFLLPRDWSNAAWYGSDLELPTPGCWQLTVVGGVPQGAIVVEAFAGSLPFTPRSP